MPPQDPFAHQLHERGKQEVADTLLLGGAGKQVIDALGIQESLQDGSGHDTDGRSLTKGAKIVSSNMVVTSS